MKPVWVRRRICGCQGFLSQDRGPLHLTVHAPCPIPKHTQGHVFTPPSMIFVQDYYIPEPLMNELMTDVSEED